MEFRVSGDWRTRQTRGYATFTPLYPRTDKSELTKLFPDEMLSNITTLDNPLQKNLADSYTMDRAGEGKHDTTRGELYDSTEGMKINGKRDLNLGVSQQPTPPRRGDFFPALFGFTNYIAGFFHNITGAMPFHQTRPSSPEKAPEAARAFTSPEEIYYDSEPVDSGFDEGCELDASPPIDEVDAIGHFSRRDCAKNSGEANRNETDVGRAQCDARGGAGSDLGAPGDMSGPEEVHAAAEDCRGKMARIQELLARKNLEALRSTKTAKLCGRPRPRRVYVEPKAVSVDSADPFDPEPLERIENVAATNFVNPGLIAESELARVDNQPRVKLEDDAKGATSQAKPVDIVESMKITETKNIAETVNDVSDKSGAGNIEIKVEPAVVSDVENKYRVSDETKVIDENACGLRDAPPPQQQSAPIASGTKAELIASCEDKVSRLRALLFDRKKKNRETKALESQPAEQSQKVQQPEKTRPALEDANATGAGFARKVDTRRSPDRPIPASTRRPPSKHHKNPHRLGAREQSRKQLRRNIDEDLCLAREADGGGSISDDGDSPRPLGTGFDEIRGQFGPKDDPFVIVFSESPPASPAGSPRGRLPSDCSDDSFIICFEDDEGGSACCFTADLESDSESDSGCESNLAVSQSFSRTVSDLTDESLYQDDGETLRSVAVEEDDGAGVQGAGGMLLTEAKKIAKRSLPAKKVRFSEAPPRVRVMRVWLYAARQARAGNWRQLAIDNERFKRRIADVDMAISWVLKPQHRSRVKFQRFMPWWHAQRRQEAAEKKVAAERLEEERIAEESRLQEEMRAEEERIAEELRIAEEDEKKQQATKVLEEATNGNVVMKKEEAQEENLKELTDILKEDIEVRNNADVDKTIEETSQIGDSIERIAVVMKEKDKKEKCKVNSLQEDIKLEKADVSKRDNDITEINIKSAGQVQIDVNYSKTADVSPRKLITKANCTNVSISKLDTTTNFANPAKTDHLKVENFINATNKGFNIHKNGVVNAQTLVIEKKS